MSLLLYIPEDLCHEVLSEWLSDVKDWMSLDVAFTNKKIRSYFLLALSRLSNACHDILHPSPSYYNWIYARNISLYVVELRDNCFKKKELLFSIRYNSIQIMKIYTRRNKNMNTIKEILSKCELTELDFQRSELLEFANLPNLKNVILCEKNQDNLTASLTLLKEQCCSLVRLDLDFINVSEFNYDLICEVVAKNPNLIDIKMIGDSSVLRAIGNHCRDIKTITLYTGGISMEAGAEAILKCPKIERLSAGDHYWYSKHEGLIYFTMGSDGTTTQQEILNFIELVPNISGYVANDEFNDNFVEDFVEYTKHTLTDINTSSNSSLSLFCWKEIVHNCSKLKTLSCSHSGNIDLREVFCKPNILEDLYLTPDEMNLDLVLFIIKACPCLRSFYVHNVFKSNDKLEEWRILMKEFSEKKRHFNCVLTFTSAQFEQVRYENGEFRESLKAEEPEPDWGEDLMNLFD